MEGIGLEIQNFGPNRSTLFVYDDHPVKHTGQQPLADPNRKPPFAPQVDLLILRRNGLCQALLNAFQLERIVEIWQLVPIPAIRLIWDRLTSKCDKLTIRWARFIPPANARKPGTVSYTHLTLPTIY